jgi:hypothetical protein
MDQARSRRPVSRARPVRRSLVEFALPPDGAPARMLSVARPLMVGEGALARPQSLRSFTASDKRGKEITQAHVNEAQKSGAPRPPPPKRQRAGKTASPTARLADAYQAKVLDLMVTNAFATLDYAQRLIRAKTPSEFVALSTSEACKQWGLIIKQVGELGSIAQELATSDVERPIVVECK